MKRKHKFIFCVIVSFSSYGILIFTVEPMVLKMLVMVLYVYTVLMFDQLIELIKERMEDE